jgi:LacI family transcriptional regulator
MTVTSKDIAKACGVSRATVDRALNNKTRISDETKEKIVKVAAEMRYRPDLLARSLVKGRTMSIGVVVFDILNRYFAQMVNAIEMEAKKNGYVVNITLQEKDPDMEIQLINGLVDRRMDGIILCPVNKGSNFTNFLKNIHIPVVIIGNLVSPGIPFIGIDERKAAMDATDLIISKNYERVVFVCPPLADSKKENVYSHEQRLKGFLDVMRKRNDIEHMVIDNWNYFNDIRRIVEKSNKRTAFFCSSDTFALDTMKFLRSIGKKVPHDYGLMGFDCIDTLQYVTPALATVFNPVEKIAVKAVENIIRLTEHQSIENFLLLEHKMVEGDSI